MSFRNHRIVVVSLFLPHTVVVGDSGVPTPEATTPVTRAPPPTIQLRLGDKSKRSLHTRQPSGPVPVSIVEDLKDKSRMASPKVMTPAALEDQANPFAKLPKLSMAASLAAAAQTLIQDKEKESGGDARWPRKHLTTHTDQSPRLRRKSSRSVTRRAPSRQTATTRHWRIEPNSHCNGGLKNAFTAMESKLSETLWIGALGTSTDKFDDALRGEIDAKMGDEYNSVPVWIPDKEFEAYYDEFCHQVLWPALHYAIPDAPKSKLFYESATYEQYVAVNKRFAEVIVENYQEGDIIMINDYHLLLLPALLRASRLSLSVPIGFFMHVAFPSSEIFRCLAVRKQLLKGILGADLVGFQTANFARHFRQTVSRILSWEAVPRGILVGDEEYAEQEQAPKKPAGRETRGRFVDIGVFPMGIDVNSINEKKKDQEVQSWVDVLKQRYAGMKLIVARDKLDEVQGVRQKVLAFESFLLSHPEFAEKVVLIQVALQTTESNEFAAAVADTVSRINSRFSTLTYQPIVFLHTQDLTFDQYLALLTVADAFLVTSLREGMALRTHEFVECQEGRHRPLILSEFTGSYSYSGFRSCLAINPWDRRGTAQAIYQALTMSDDEARSRWEDLHSHVTTQSAQAFVSGFLARCLRASTERRTLDAPILDVTRVLPRYKHSAKRMIFVDLEDTLLHRPPSEHGLASSTSPPEEIIEVLSTLVADKKNQVWLLSGFPAKGMLQEISERIPKLGIVAENGCFIKTPNPERRGSRTALASPISPTSGEPSGRWISMISTFNPTWKAPCLEILNYFTERTPGSFIEEREASIVWRYTTNYPSSGSADRQWAVRQAAEAQNHIFDSLGERYGLRIIPGRTSFLTLPANVSRSSAVGAILHPGGPKNYNSPPSSWMEDGVTSGDVDFVLALSGDDQLLRRLNELDGAETCSTSGKGTEAIWRLDTEENVAPGDVGTEEAHLENGKGKMSGLDVMRLFAGLTSH